MRAAIRWEKVAPVLPWASRQVPYLNPDVDRQRQAEEQFPPVWPSPKTSGHSFFFFLSPKLTRKWENARKTCFQSPHCRWHWSTALKIIAALKKSIHSAKRLDSETRWNEPLSFSIWRSWPSKMNPDSSVIAVRHQKEKFEMKNHFQLQVDVFI